MFFQRRNCAGGDSGEEGAEHRVDGRASALGHDDGRAGQAEGGVPHAGYGDGGECVRCERRGRGNDHGVRGSGERASTDATGTCGGDGNGGGGPPPCWGWGRGGGREIVGGAWGGGWGGLLCFSAR